MNAGTNWTVARLAGVAPVPWRNGGGVTRELLAWPDAACWTVRLSVANIDSDGPFSRFDGVQRWFAVLSGGGVRLHVAGKLHTLTSAAEPLCFDGAVPVDCALLGGPTLDFNLMARGGTARMERVRGTRQGLVRAGHLAAAWTADAPARLEADGAVLALAPMSLAWRVVASESKTGAQAHFASTDGLWMEVAP